MANLAESAPPPPPLASIAISATSFARMAAPVVEAKSLSSLTALAFNPPAYPRNPTHLRHEPLVLYIARVPGSKGTAIRPHVSATL